MTHRPTAVTRIFNLRQALIAARGWVKHWGEDRASGLLPTQESVDLAINEITAALNDDAALGEEIESRVADP